MSESLIERLKQALEMAKEQNLELLTELATLKAAPLEYGVVIKTGNLKELPAAQSFEDFKKGVRVRVRATRLQDYPLVGYPAGRIVKVEKKTAWVYFLDGREESILINDLDLQDKKTEMVPSVTITTQSGIREVIHPEEMELAPGDAVLVRQSGAVVDRAPLKQYGQSAVVKELIDELTCSIQEGDHTKIVYKAGHEVEPGDEVILDSSGVTIAANRKQPERDFNLEQEISVRWDEIGGQEDAKVAMKEAIELPYTNPGLFKAYGKKTPKGVILYGPPGCGKTLLAKAGATALAKLSGGSLKDSGFIYIKGPEILNEYVGVTERTIRSLFKRAKAYKARTGHTATIFIDEAESILSKRGSGVSSDVDKTIVPMFLTEMDGLEDSAAFIILATNRPDMMDPAVVREGRIDRKIKIDRPDKDAARDIVLIAANGVPLKDEITDICEQVVTEIFQSELAKRASGAMIVGMVDQAVSVAMRRDLKSGVKKPSGLTVEDIMEAADEIRKHKPKKEEVS